MVGFHGRMKTGTGGEGDIVVWDIRLTAAEPNRLRLRYVLVQDSA